MPKKLFYSLTLSITILLLYEHKASSQILTEFSKYEEIPMIIKLSISNTDEGKKISKSIFSIITNEIFRYSYQDGSYIHKITKSAYKKYVNINDDLKTILGKTLYYYSLTKAISPTLGYLIDIWGFETGQFYVPSPSEISNALKISSIKNLVISDNKILLKNKKTKFYLKPFAIGIALLKTKEFLEKNKIKNAFISVGNNFSLCMGKKDQTEWIVGISNPKNRDENETLLTINISNSSIYTASINENSFVDGFKTYHSVIDPRTGYPANNGTLSVSVIHNDPVEAAILSRTLLVLGKDGGLQFAEKRKVKALFITLEDNQTRIYKTSEWIKHYDKPITNKSEIKK